MNKNQHFEIYQQMTEALQKGRYSEALDQCDQLLRDNKKNAFLICFKGFILNELNRRTKAQEYFKAAYEVVRLGLATDYVVETDRLLAQMIIDKLIKMQEFLLRTELLFSKAEGASLYKSRLENAKATQLVLSRKLFDYLIPDDYKELSKLSKTTNAEFNSLIKEAMERVRKIEQKVDVSRPIFNTEKFEKTQGKLKKVEKIMIALQHEINNAQKGILNVKMSQLHALLEVK